MEKSPEAFRTISDVAAWLDTPAHVLRFWESRFSQVKPVKRAGGRRYYRPADMMLLGGIKRLLHEDGLTIRGVQKILREEGVKFVSALSPPLEEGAPGLLIEGHAEPVEAVEAVAKAPLPGDDSPAEMAEADEAPMQEDAESEATEILPLAFRPRPEPDEAILPGLDLAAGARPAPEAEAAIPSFRRHPRPPVGEEPAATLPFEAAPETSAEEPVAALAEADLLLGPEPEVAQDPVEAEPEPEPEPEAHAPAAGPAEPGPEAEAPEQAGPDILSEAAPELEAQPEAEPEPEPLAEPVAEPPAPAIARPLGTGIARSDPADDDPAFAPVAPPLRTLIRSPALRQALAAERDRAGQALARLQALVERMASAGQ
ncbi:MerR family transcriptional regulator [Rhodovulum sp.]|uniref:MerR family transcriptional regulator n=1 Tax=Rhodovulum sp. TaxID=34009 RepID=UPI00257B1D93|nr:MerR family transcriptional regulator [Rhodovulum sp.]